MTGWKSALAPRGTDSLPRFSRRQHDDPARPGGELRRALADAAAQTARFRYRSAVADPFGDGDGLSGWEDVGFVDFPGQVAWYRRAWTAPQRDETVGILRPDALVTLGADGAIREVPGALYLLNATSNPLGMLRLLDPEFTSTTPAGADRWRIQIDYAAARRALGIAALGPAAAYREPTVAATAEVLDGRLAVIAVQVGVWGEPHAWAAVRFSGWGAPLPAELAELAAEHTDFGRLRAALTG